MMKREHDSDSPDSATVKESGHADPQREDGVIASYLKEKSVTTSKYMGTSISVECHNVSLSCQFDNDKATRKIHKY